MNYPEIIRQNQHQDELHLELKISPELEAFAGHFDDFPIVPGVVQIQWALHFFKNQMSSLPAHKCQVNKLGTVKFQHVITPHSLVTLSLKFDSEKQCLIFAIKNAEQAYSSGKIFLQAADA